MFTNKKLIIGVFLASLAAITITHRAILPALNGSALTGQIPGMPIILPQTFPSDESFFSSDASSSKEPGSTDGTAGEPATAITNGGNGGDVFDGCKDYEKIFPRDDYKSIPEDKTLVDGVWRETYKRESDRIDQEAFPKDDKGGTASTGEGCKKKERDMIANLMKLLKQYECALTEEAGDTFAQGGRVLAEQRKAKNNDEPLTVLDLLFYSQTESQQIDQAMAVIKNTREQILSPTYGRCPSEKEAQAETWQKMSKLLEEMSTLITRMNEERQRSSSSSSDEGGGGDWTPPPDDSGGGGDWQDDSGSTPVIDEGGGGEF